MMGMLGEKKKVASIIVASALGPKEETHPAETMNDKLLAANQMLKAIKDGDIEKLSSALEAHYYACEKEEPEELGG